jgi:hypothetical protein
MEFSIHHDQPTESNSNNNPHFPPSFKIIINFSQTKHFNKTKTSPWVLSSLPSPPRNPPPPPRAPLASSARMGLTVPPACAPSPAILFPFHQARLPNLQLPDNRRSLSATISGPYSTSRTTSSAAMDHTVQPACAILNEHLRFDIEQAVTIPI